MVGYVTSQLVDVLKALKGVSVVHFDIKIENVLVDGNFDVKLCDFSISKRLDRRTKVFRHSSSGTGIYIAPENLKCLEVDFEDVFKSDIYSLGVLVYKMVYKCNPYNISDSDDKNEISKKISNNRLIFPKEVRVSKELVKELRNTLEKNVKRRWGLDELLESEWVKNLNVLQNYSDKENLVEDLMENNIPEFYNGLTFQDVDNSAETPYKFSSMSDVVKKSFSSKKRKSVTCF